MNFKIETTLRFERSAKILSKKFPSLKSDLIRLRQELLINPFSGTPIGKDCFKIRLQIRSKGKGKSGGGRVITCVKILRERIYLLMIFDKSEKENITDLELDNALKDAGLY